MKKKILIGFMIAIISAIGGFSFAIYVKNNSTITVTNGTMTVGKDMPEGIYEARSVNNGDDTWLAVVKKGTVEHNIKVDMSDEVDRRINLRASKIFMGEEENDKHNRLVFDAHEGDVVQIQGKVKFYLLKD